MDEKADLESVLSKLAAGSDRIVANPSDIEQLLREGIHLEQPPRRTLEESVDLLFSSRKQSALERARELPAPPPKAPPSIASLYEEISTCIVFGLHGAAITLSGVLVEFALKFATYIREAGGYLHYNPEHWDEFEQITFDPAIKRASTAGLITPEQAEELRRFKNVIRNPYNHYNIRKITSHAVWNKVKIVNLNTGTFEEKSIPVKDDPVLQAQAKPVVDSMQVFTVFRFADAVVKALLAGIAGS